VRNGGAGGDSDLEVIATARIPIIRFVDAAHALHFDVTLDAQSGLESTDLARQYTQEFPEFRHMVLVLKQWLLRRQLHETYNGGVGSFLLQLMVAFALQTRMLATSRQRAAHAAGGANGVRSVGSEHTLASSLLDFFELFGVKLNYRTTGISLRHGGSFFPKAARKGWMDSERPMLLCVENPLEPDTDVGKNAFNIHAVRRALSQSYYALLAAMKTYKGDADGTAGILGTIFDADTGGEMEGRFDLKYSAEGAVAEPPAAVPPALDWSCLEPRDGALSPVGLQEEAEDSDSDDVRGGTDQVVYVADTEDSDGGAPDSDVEEEEDVVDDDTDDESYEGGRRSPSHKHGPQVAARCRKGDMDRTFGRSPPSAGSKNKAKHREAMKVRKMQKKANKARRTAAKANQMKGKKGLKIKKNAKSKPSKVRRVVQR